MTTPVNIWLGTSVGTLKSIQVTPGPNIAEDVEFNIGLPGAFFTMHGWNAVDIINAWTGSDNDAIGQVTASAAKTLTDGTPDPTGSVIFTADTIGQDFDIICTLPSGFEVSSSTMQELVFNPMPTGGSFTITIAGQTTSNISYNSTPATFAAAMQTALAALVGFSATDILVTAEPSPGKYLLDFSRGQFIGQNVPSVQVTHLSLTGGNASVTVTVNQIGSTAVSGQSQINTLAFPINGTHTETINTIQTLDSLATNGSFTISISGYGTTVSIPFNGTRTLVKSAVEGIVGAGNTNVTGGPLYYAPTASHQEIVIEFVGALAGQAIPAMTVTPTATTLNEIQSINPGGLLVSGTFTLTFNTHTTGNLNYNETAANVQTALVALSGVGAGQVTCVGGPLIAYGSSTTTPQAGANDVQAVQLGSGLYQYTPVASEPSSWTVVNGTTDMLAFDILASGKITAFTILVSGPAGQSLQIALNEEIRYILQQTSVNESGFSFLAITPTTATTTDSFSNSQTTYTFDVASTVNALIAAGVAAGYWDYNKSLRFQFAVSTTNTGVIGNLIDSRGFDPLHPTNNVGSTYYPKASITNQTVTLTPILINFGGTLAAADQPQTTITTSVVGGTITTSTIQNGLSSGGSMTPARTQTGGSVSVQNIKGGTFGLTINGTTVAGLPYNCTATQLATAINAAFGSTVCTVSGGPAPGSTLTITFENALGLQPVTLSYLNALQTNLNGSIQQTVVQLASTPYAPTNCWDMTVCPGNGTLGIATTGLLKINLGNTAVSGTAGTANPVGECLLQLSTLDAHLIQASINEALGGDACRVSRIGHSIEQGSYSPTNATTQYSGFWYVQDSYRIVFAPQFATITVVVALSGATLITPVSAPDTSDTIDQFPEKNRVVVGLTALNLVSVTAASTAVALLPDNNTIWRYKMLPQWDSGDESHVGFAAPIAGKIQFVWQKKTIDDSGNITLGLPIQSSAIIDWDSPTSVILTTLQAMWFRKNVTVTGTLHNSWLPESTAEAPGLLAYGDLKVTLADELWNMPLDDYGYTLTCVLSNQVFPASTAFQKDMVLYSSTIQRTIPPHYNRRERISIVNAAQTASLLIGTCKYFASIAGTATAATLQAGLDAQFPDWVAAATLGSLPEKFIHPIYVYGTTFLDGPMEFEFTSAGAQQNINANLVVSSIPVGVTVATIGVSTAGILAVAAIDAIQTVFIAGVPYAGTFTLTFNTHTTSSLAYNISLTALQTAVTTANFSSPTITGDYINGFVFDWAGSGGPRATITTASSLSNALVTSDVTHLGGLSATFLITEIDGGEGPNYVDVPSNWSLGRCLNSGDLAVFDDSPEDALYGIELTSPFTVQQIKTGADTLFAYIKNRRVFQDGQIVQFAGDDTAPGTMTFSNLYIIANASVNAINSFTLIDAVTGATVQATSPGLGNFTLTVSNLQIQVYNRFGTIGLPHNDGTTVQTLPTALTARLAAVTIGLGDGNGVSLICLNSMDANANILVKKTSNPPDVNIPVVQLQVNSPTAQLHIQNGYVGVSIYAEQSAQLSTVTLESGAHLSMKDAVVDTFTSAPGAIFSLQNVTIAEPITCS